MSTAIKVEHPLDFGEQKISSESGRKAKSRQRYFTEKFQLRADSTERTPLRHIKNKQRMKRAEIFGRGSTKSRISCFKHVGNKTFYSAFLDSAVRPLHTYHPHTQPCSETKRRGGGKRDKRGGGRKAFQPRASQIFSFGTNASPGQE